VTENLSLKREHDNLRIIDCCNDIEDAVSQFGHSMDDLIKNIHFQHSCAFSVEQIGEHAKRLSHEFIKKITLK